MNLEDFLTVAQAARKIGISQDALRKRIDRGSIAATHWLGRVLIHKNDAKAAKQ